MIFFTGAQGSITASADTSRFFKGPRECISHLYKTNGIKALYRGASAMAVRDIPGYGIYILVYEWLYEKINERKLGDKYGLFASVMAGGSAGVVSWFLMAPLDVVKSLLQADTTQTTYRGLVHCARHTATTLGFKAFYAGCAVNLIRGFPVNGITFVVYSQTLKALKYGENSSGNPMT